jgi:hypothetical protein
VHRKTSFPCQTLCLEQDYANRFEARGVMSILQAILFGVMLSWTPSVVLLAWLLWREGIFEESAHKENAQRQSLYSDFERRDYCFDASQRPLQGIPPDAPLHLPDPALPMS